ncbi:ABC transporter substrate-binding protein [Chloroflexota bacterium]
MKIGLAEAKKLMADAGYANGFKLRIVARNLKNYERMITVHADYLQRHLNIDATIDVRDKAEAQKMRDAGDFDLYLELFYALIGDLDEYSEYFVSNGPGNYGGYSNSEMDQLCGEQSWAMDLDKRIKLGQEIEQLALTDLSILPTGSFHTYVIAWYPYVKGFTHGFSGYSQAHERMEYVWLDK